MSLIQISVALYYTIAIVSCVSFKSTAPTEVTAGTEVVKNNLYHTIMSVLHNRIKIHNVDEGQKKARVKKTTGLTFQAAKMPPMKLMGLMILMFRNMFSKELIDGDPPLRPDAAVEPFVKMSRTGLEALKENVSHKHN